MEKLFHGDNIHRDGNIIINNGPFASIPAVANLILKKPVCMYVFGIKSTSALHTRCENSSANQCLN